jgi:hypothetical protein
VSRVRIKLDFVVDWPGDGIPRTPPLDIIEHGVSAFRATEILPGAKVSLNIVRVTSDARKETDARCAKAVRGWSHERGRWECTGCRRRMDTSRGMEAHSRAAEKRLPPPAPRGLTR